MKQKNAMKLIRTQHRKNTNYERRGGAEGGVSHCCQIPAEKRGQAVMIMVPHDFVSCDY
jgi:hypothetical protein